MKLGTFLSYACATEVAAAAESLGIEVALVPEGFRSDAVSVLGAVAQRTSTMALGSGVMQIPARTPVLTALTAATLDALSGGRFRLGLGVSNPDVSLGWYGVPFDRPLERTREYVEIVRTALSGERVRFAGKHFRLPPTDDADPAWLHGAPVRADIPIHLAAVGPRSLELTGEIADGWIGVFSSPEGIAESLRHIAAGRARTGRSMDGFDVVPSIPIALGDDPRTAAEGVRAYFANFLGLGTKDRSIYYALAVRLGFAEEAERVHDAVARGDREEAAAQVPFDFIDQVSLLGDEQRIAARMAEYAKVGVTTLGLTLLAPGAQAQLATVRAAARARTAMSELATSGCQHTEREHS